MLLLLSVLCASTSALDLKAICPGFPLCDTNLIAYYQRLEAQAPADPCPNFPLCDVHHVALQQKAAAGVSKRSTEALVPGTIPGLIPGSAAAAQWWSAQQTQQLANTRAGVVVPGAVPGLVAGSAAAAQWWQDQQIQLARIAA